MAEKTNLNAAPYFDDFDPENNFQNPGRHPDHLWTGPDYCSRDLASNE